MLSDETVVVEEKKPQKKKLSASIILPSVVLEQSFHNPNKYYEVCMCINIISYTIY